MVALVRPSETPLKNMPPRYAALLQERDLELEILAHMLAQGSAYREAEMLGLSPSDFIQSSSAGTRLIREPDNTGHEVERTVDTVADHAILAEALSLSRSERMNIHDAIEEICHIRMAKTRNQIDRYRLEVQRQSVPALVEKARGVNPLTHEEFQRRVRSLRRLRDALADEDQLKAIDRSLAIPSNQNTKGTSNRKSNRQESPTAVMPFRRSVVNRPGSESASGTGDYSQGSSSEIATEFEQGKPVTVTTTIFTPANPHRPVLFHRTVIEQNSQPASNPLPAAQEEVVDRLFKRTEVKPDPKPTFDSAVEMSFHIEDDNDAFAQSPAPGPGYIPGSQNYTAPPPTQNLQPYAPSLQRAYPQPTRTMPARPSPPTPSSNTGSPLDNIEPLSNFADLLSNQILTPSAQGIAAPSAALNEALGGGWSRGKLYLLAGPPESGKTTFCAWAADHAARNQMPVLFVSFELGKAQLWLHGIARAARLDSRTIENQPWQNLPSEQSGHVHKQVQSAIGSYTQLAKFLNVVEARPGTSCFDLRAAITRVRTHYQMAVDAPVLVIVDSITEMGTGISDIDFGNDTAIKTERVIARLKQLAREMNIPVLAIAPTGSNASAEMNANGEAQLETLRKEPWFDSAADVIMVLASNEISGGDQLQLLINRYRENQGVLTRLRRIREDSPSDPSGLERSTYSRLSVLKNRGGVRSELLFLYQRAFHNFIPFDLLLELSR